MRSGVAIVGSYARWWQIVAQKITGIRHTQLSCAFPVGAICCPGISWQHSTQSVVGRRVSVPVCGESGRDRMVIVLCAWLIPSKFDAK